MKTQVSSPAAVDALPKPTLLRRVIPDGYWYGDIYGYTAEQMQAVIAAEREPLTDEQITRVWFESASGKITPTPIEFARAIEAMHGIGVKGEA